MKENKRYTKRILGEDEVIPLIYDTLFKLVFGDINHLDRLNYLLSTILNKNVEVIELLPNDLIEDNRVNKKNEVDLLCKLDKEYVSIEINTDFDDAIVKRNYAYISRLLSKELNAGDSYKKDNIDNNNDDKEIKMYYQININTKDFLGEPFEICHVKGEFSNMIAAKFMESYYINVSYYVKKWYTLNGKGLTDFEKLMVLIGTNKKSVIECLNDNKILKDIGDAVKKYSEDDDLLYYYDRDEQLVSDAKRVSANETREKLEKEFEEELNEKISLNTKETSLDIARRLKEKGMDISDIASVTNLSLEEVEKL